MTSWVTKDSRYAFKGVRLSTVSTCYNCLNFLHLGAFMLSKKLSYMMSVHFTFAKNIETFESSS